MLLHIIRSASVYTNIYTNICIISNLSMHVKIKQVLASLRNKISYIRVSICVCTSLLYSRLASVYLVLDWHRSRREEKKNPLSRYLFSTHVASIGRDLAGYNRQRDYYWLRLSGTCGNDIPFSGSDFRAPKPARHSVACVGRAFSI